MSFYFTYFIAILIHQVTSSGELFILLHNEPRDQGTTRNMTCVSNDDEAALIWNYNYQKNESNTRPIIVEDFQPKRPKPENVTACAIWNSTMCIGQWGNSGGWDVVNSTNEYMGPVFDHRWEGFKEFTFQGLIQDEEYQYVGKVNESSGTAVFSVRGKNGLHIFLCENADPTKGMCFWIIIGGWNGSQSVIRSCVDGVPKTKTTASSGNCSQVASTKHGLTDVLNIHEWRTFRVAWIAEEKKIQINRLTGRQDQLFFEAQVDRWGPVSHVSIRSNEASRVRFHFYEYFLTRKSDVIMTTAHFNHYDKNFCVKLLVGLCPNCLMQISLTDKDGRRIAMQSIYGNEEFADDGPLLWQLINLTTTLQSQTPKLVHLQIQAFLNRDKDNGQWAVDNFHLCESVGSQRKSTITIHQETLSATPIWPQVNCQKLSYRKTDVIDAGNTSLAYDAGREYPNYHRVRSKREDEYRVSYAETASDVPPALNVLEVLNADPETNTITIVLWPPEQADSEIESYHVMIHSEEGRLLRTGTFDVLKGQGRCDYDRSLVCFNNLKIPSDAGAHPKIEFYEKYLGVKEHGSLTTLKLEEPLDFYYNKEPYSPRDFRIMPLDHDIVTLSWKSIKLASISKIKKFRIVVDIVRTQLLENVNTQYPKPVEYMAVEEKEEYNETLSLPPSTEYRFGIVSVSGRNITSSEYIILHKMPASIGFVSHMKPRVHQRGSFMEVDIPIIVNATTNTTVKVIMKGLSTCVPSQSQNPPLLVNPTTTVTEWVAKVFQVEHTTPEPLKIHIKNHRGVALDCSLNFGEPHTITFVVTDLYSGLSDNLTSITFIVQEEMNGGQPLAWFGILPVLALVMLAIFLWHTNRRGNLREVQEFKNGEPNTPLPCTTPRTNGQTVRHTIGNLTSQSDAMTCHEREQPRETHADNSIALCTAEMLIPETSTGENQLPSIMTHRLYDLPNEPDSCSVEIDRFEEYVKRAASNGALHSQFRLLPEGLRKPCVYGGLPENVKKNRDMNLIAYDETRVILEKIPGDPYSDYINASYIQGYENRMVYIAAQGPKPETVNDFWRMVWQEQVQVICMLTNVTEGTEKMSETYWPEVETRMEYGDFSVSNVSNKVFADYTFRTFELRYQQSTRIVKHLHFTGWPSRGVPKYVRSLVAFLRKLESTPAGNGPIVVHCSTGDHRTGTLILSDICLRQVLAEKVINVTAVITRLRESRANMVGTLQQYLLAHIIVIESMTSQSTQMPCTSDLSIPIQRMRLRLLSHVRRLNDTMWQEQALDCFADPKSTCTVKKVSPLATDSDLLEIKNSRFDAVSIDGVQLEEQYLTSSIPSTENLSNFWKFVADKSIGLIIILQCSDPRKPTCFNIIPNRSIGIPGPEIRVDGFSTINESEDFTKEKLMLVNPLKKNASMESVIVLTCKGWVRGYNEEPAPPATLVSLWKASEEIPRKKGATLVLCHDGIFGCGLYVALSFLLERMAVEGECDVISAVRAVRRSKPEFVQSMDQFDYLYEAALNYTDGFQLYANFS